MVNHNGKNMVSPAPDGALQAWRERLPQAIAVNGLFDGGVLHRGRGAGNPAPALRVAARDHRRFDNLSGKMDAFVELLDTVLEGGHRVLVFSQFVKMLKILRGHLIVRGIPHAYLDGATLRRREEIERFQSESDRKVFLLSLKAGGTGLNLTAADYVILYDPWWNPAVENQAIDRTHRIGQTRNVVAYRMVTRGTVEEKILKLQARKAELVRAVIENDTAFSKRLTLDDLEELFSAD